MKARLAPLIAALAVVACNDSGRPQPSANKDNVCNQIAQVVCYDLFQCCSEAQIESYLRVSDPRTEGECESDVTRLCEQRTAQVDASVKAGRVTFDGAAMTACLKALTVNGDCTSIGAALPWVEACMQPAWIGAVAVGSQCTRSYECAGTGAAYCAANQMCAALPTEGMACANGTCATGFYCGVGTCHALLPAGATCTSTTQCAKGNYCTTGATRQCAALRNAGESCTGNAACASSQCLPGTCAGSSTTCFSSADCTGRCSNNANAFCTLDRDCGNGACSIGGATCTGPTQCVGAGNVCVFPNTCTLNACMGDVVCAGSQVSADYCTGATAAVPPPP